MQVSKDTPFLYSTSVTHKRLPVFRKDALKYVLCDALNKARESSGILIFAYAIMLDHLHIITDRQMKQSEILRYINGVSANKVIRHLKDNGFESSLVKLRTEEKKDGYKHSLWEHHSNTFEIKTETVLMQKVNYIHRNPVEEGLCELPEDYLFSSARFWKGCPLENEPLEMDIKKIRWRKG
jgi:putative transposase